MSSVDKIKVDGKKAERRLSKATPKVSGRAEGKKNNTSSLYPLPSTAALSLIKCPVLIGNSCPAAILCLLICYQLWPWGLRTLGFQNHVRVIGA